MKIIYSFWTNKGKNLPKVKTLEFYTQLCELSVAMAHKHSESVELFADSEGIDFLQKTNCKFTNIVNIDAVNDLHFNRDYWNFGKLYTYSLQSEPFIHIDFDVILRSKFSENFDNSTPDIITERIRPFDMCREFNNVNTDNLPKPSGLICSGLLGSCRPEIFKQTFEHALKICNTKKPVLFDDLVAIEEYYLSCVATAQFLNVKALNENSFYHLQGENKQTKYRDFVYIMHKRLN